MATSEHTHEVEIAVSVAQGQSPLEPSTENAARHGTPTIVLSTTTDKQMAALTSETLATFCDYYSWIQCLTLIFLKKIFCPCKKWGRRTSGSERPLEDPTAIVNEGTVTTSEHSSTPGRPLKGSAVSISEQDLPEYLPPPSNVSIAEGTPSDQLPAIASASLADTSEQSGLLEALSSSFRFGDSESGGESDGESDDSDEFSNFARAVAFQSHFKKTGNIDDITPAISHYERALRSGLNDSTIFNDLGALYALRFRHAGDLQDINCAIFRMQSALDSIPPNHAHFRNVSTNLGNSYTARFKHTGNLQDIDCAIYHLQSTVDSTPSGHAGLPSGLNNLGNSYSERFKHTGNLQDINCAISHQQSAVDSTPPSHADLPSRLINLGNSYANRFDHTGDLQDINRAISHQKSAVDSIPPGHAHLLRGLNNLAGSYAARFNHTSDFHDIKRAISHQQSIVDSTPPGHIDLPTWFSNLGIYYSRLFECTGDLQDVDRAISHHQSAVDSTPPGHANFPRFLCQLGDSYTSRFNYTGKLQDINHAISRQQSAVDSTPSSHADLPVRLQALGNSYVARFNQTGDLQDIDRAISHMQSAVNSTPSGNARLQNYFNSLGGSYFSRFRRTHDFQDIDRAISHFQTALDSTPPGHADLLTRFNNLGSSYFHRFQHTGNLQDIDRSISYCQKAVDSTPSGHANLPILFTNLGLSYSDRFECTGSPQDIDCAISHQKNALDSTPDGHAELPRRFSSLGTSYSNRFRHTGEPQDINYAISHHQCAVDSAPSGHANRPGWLINLGNSYLARFKSTDYFPDVQNSIDSYRRGAAEANGTPSIRLKCASQAAMLSRNHDYSHCLSDSALAISLLEEVAGLEQTINRRHTNLHDRSDLVGSAVATALRYGKADLALEWLEQGRCLVWSQLNQLRTPIDNLGMRSPSLADRFKKVASALESDGTRSASYIPSPHSMLAEEIRLQDDTLNHTLHATEYKQLLKEIRCLPDFHDFLVPPKATDLLFSLPSDGTVVIFNVHTTRCDALAVISGRKEPLHIPLNNFSLLQAERLQNTLQFDVLKQREVEDQDRSSRPIYRNPPSMSSVLNELWCKVVQPILEALEYSLKVPPNLADRRRLWWCPTGPLAFLPLHAAGVYGSAYQPGSCVSDFVVSSYTTTVRSINDKFIATSTYSGCTNLVLISQPNTPGLPPIPSTRKETHDLEALMKESAVDALLLEDSGATTDMVMAEMKSRSWVHFACHGVQDVEKPLESGLCLHDGRLELLEIIKQEIPNPDLAFLSACQTSKGNIKLSEEVVHLAAGMLVAGYRGVVGTMWSISDEHGPEFATEFYQYLLREKGLEGLDSTRAAYALDFTTRKVRERLGGDDTAFLTWVPYVHFGY